MSRDPRVDAYIHAAQPFAREILDYLRAVVHEAVPAVGETIKWGFPHFEHHGVLCSMAAFKAHCVFGFWHRGMESVLGEYGARSETAMGSLGRITRLADLPVDKEMIRLVRESALLNASGAPARPRSAGRPASKELPVPGDA